MFALEEAEPDFDLIEPGRIGRQPMDLEVQPSITWVFLLQEPGFELFGSVSCSIIENEDHSMYLTAQRFGDNLLLHEGLEIDKALALTRGSVDLAISDGESSKQMSGAATMIAGFM